MLDIRVVYSTRTVNIIKTDWPIESWWFTTERTFPTCLSRVSQKTTCRVDIGDSTWRAMATETLDVRAPWAYLLVKLEICRKRVELGMATRFTGKAGDRWETHGAWQRYLILQVKGVEFALRACLQVKLEIGRKRVELGNDKRFYLYL